MQFSVWIVWLFGAVWARSHVAVLFGTQAKLIAYVGRVWQEFSEYVFLKCTHTDTHTLRNGLCLNDMILAGVCTWGMDVCVHMCVCVRASFTHTQEIFIEQTLRAICLDFWARLRYLWLERSKIPDRLTRLISSVCIIRVSGASRCVCWSVSVRVSVPHCFADFLPNTHPCKAIHPILDVCDINISNICTCLWSWVGKLSKVCCGPCNMITNTFVPTLS